MDRDSLQEPGHAMAGNPFAETSGTMAARVYAFLAQIPQGRVVTYGQIAEWLGNRNLSRAIGGILHRNPDGERYPCYRVVNRLGELSASYAFGGEEEQKRRLERDGIAVIRVENGRARYRIADLNAMLFDPKAQQNLE